MDQVKAMLVYLRDKHRMRDEDIASEIGCSFMSIRNWREEKLAANAVFRRGLTSLYLRKKAQEKKVA